MRLRLGWLEAFSFFYFFDFGLTAFMLLTNDKWVDLAHYLFIPFIGVYGYLVLRIALYFPVLLAFRIAKGFVEFLPLKALTCLYISVSFYNIACYYLILGR